MTIKENVESILLSDEESRGNDKRLIMLYWRDIDGINFSRFESEFTEKATMPESIRRARQLIQEDGRCLPSDDILLKRRKRQEEMKSSIITNREVI